MNPYYEPFTLDGEARKPIVEYEGFAYSHDREVVEHVCGPRIARLVTRCRVLERCGELLASRTRTGLVEEIAWERDIGFAVMNGNDALINAIAHRIAKEAGL